jgi:hypothetical protein
MPTINRFSKAAIAEVKAELQKPRVAMSASRRLVFIDLSLAKMMTDFEINSLRTGL